MNIRHLAVSLAAGVLVCGAKAQQNNMPDMPGMNMPAPSKPRQSSEAPADPVRVPHKAPPMQGVEHPRHEPRVSSAAPNAQGAQQQQGASAAGFPEVGSDVKSITVPIQDLQEPEAPGFRTGADLPAPELLTKVLSREPMHVEDFLHLADAHNPTLVQAQREIDRSEQQARQAGLPPDPVLGYSGDHIRGGSYHGGEEGVFFSQVFVLGRKLALRRDIYRAEGRANRYVLEAQRARVHNDVVASFISALSAQETVAVQDRMLKVALDAETNAHELARVGQADAPAVLTAEIAAEQAKIDFQEAQRMFLADYAQLATIAGQSSLPASPLTGNLVEPPELDSRALVERDAAESPLVREAEAAADVAQMRLKDSRRERVPNLNVTAGEWYSGEELGSTARKADWESFAQAGVQIPLWNRNQGNISAAQAQLDYASKDVVRTRLWTRNRAEVLAQEYERNRFAAGRYRTEMLPRARRAYQLEVMKYQQMAQSYPPVLSAQKLLFSLQLSYIQVLEGEWRAATALLNYTLMDGLAAPAGMGDDTTTMNTPTGMP